MGVLCSKSDIPGLSFSYAPMCFLQLQHASPAACMLEIGSYLNAAIACCSAATLCCCSTSSRRSLSACSCAACRRTCAASRADWA